MTSKPLNHRLIRVEIIHMSLFHSPIPYSKLHFKYLLEWAVFISAMRVKGCEERRAYLV